MRGRQLLDLWRAVWSNPEKGGMVCQDVCAKLLLPRLCTSSSVFVDVGASVWFGLGLLVVGQVLFDLARDKAVVAAVLSVVGWWVVTLLLGYS